MRLNINEIHSIYKINTALHSPYAFIGTFTQKPGCLK